MIAQIRKLTHDPALAVLNDKERADLAKIDPPDGLRLVHRPTCRRWRAARSPRATGPSDASCWCTPPSTELSVWNGRDLLRIASVLQHLHLPERQGGRDVRQRGHLRGDDPLRSCSDGPIATVASLIAVLSSWRSRSARRGRVMALGTLIAGRPVDGRRGGLGATCASPS